MAATALCTRWSLPADYNRSAALEGKCLYLMVTVGSPEKTELEGESQSVQQTNCL